MDPADREKRGDLRTDREIDQRPKLIFSDRMQKPAYGDQSDSEDYYPKYPSLCLSVETGEKWQDRGILDAFLHAIPAVNVRRSARWQTFVIRLLQVPGSDDPSPAVTPQKAPQHTDHVNLLPFGPPSTLQWLLLSSLLPWP